MIILYDSLSHGTTNPARHDLKIYDFGCRIKVLFVEFRCLFFNILETLSLSFQFSIILLDRNILPSPPLFFSRCVRLHYFVNIRKETRCIFTFARSLHTWENILQQILVRGEKVFSSGTVGHIGDLNNRLLI